ncbi:hypothetical protein N7475_004864 [Penicillium sp. IBT 31633x]|nr:hypothetical protein N7475_004864 [Penicillium sp. IBT 31633x]
MEYLFRSWNGQDVCSKALTFIDASFRAITSLREIVAEVYEATPSSDITMKMQIYGWIVNVVEEVEEAEWDIDRLSDEYGDDEYPSDDYDADDYNIDNDSDFWRRAAD